jgi:hypothetical protein
MVSSQSEGVFLGDILLTFNSELERFPARRESSPWTLAKGEPPWQLWLQPAQAGWHGYPWRQISLNGWDIWLLGELFPTRAINVTDLLVEVVTGKGSASELNGHFLIIAWQRESREWHIWTDRFGTLHAYYATNNKRAALGTFHPAVSAAASRRSFDLLGIAGFFACGFFPGDKTFFEDVKILRPACHYVYDENGGLLQQKRYWHWRHEPDEKRSYDDTVSEFARLFQEVMREQIGGGRLALPISGGLDSRSTVAAITQPEGSLVASSHLWSYSYGYSDDSVETTIARQVAGARGLPFSAITIRPYLFDRLDLILASVEAFQDVIQCRQAAVVEEISRHADYLLAAHWGDVWLDDMGLVDKPAKPIANDLAGYALHKMEKGGRDWLLNNLQQSGLGEGPEALLLEMVRQEMAPLSQIADPDFRIKAFKTDQWSFRWTTASLRMYQAAAYPRLPFYDTRLSDFFCTVPSTFVSQRRLQIDYLKRYAPDLARIKWQVYDTNLFRYQFFNSWIVPKRAVKKAWRLLRGKQVIERNWEVQLLLNPQGRHGLEHWLLRPGLRLHEFFPLAALAKLLHDFYQDPLMENRGYTLSMLLTFSAWLEHYA